MDKVLLPSLSGVTTKPLERYLSPLHVLADINAHLVCIYKEVFSVEKSLLVKWRQSTINVETV